MRGWAGLGSGHGRALTDRSSWSGVTPEGRQLPLADCGWMQGSLTIPPLALPQPLAPTFCFLSVNLTPLGASWECDHTVFVHL